MIFLLLKHSCRTCPFQVPRASCQPKAWCPVCWVSPSCHLPGSAQRQPQTLPSTVSQGACLGKSTAIYLSNESPRHGSVGPGDPFGRAAGTAVQCSVSLHGSSSLCVCKAWRVWLRQLPSSATERQPEYFHFDSQLENLTFNDDFFSKEEKTWEACGIWLTIVFSVAFPPWKYLGWWKFAPQIIIPLFSAGK